VDGAHHHVPPPPPPSGPASIVPLPSSCAAPTLDVPRQYPDAIDGHVELGLVAAWKSELVCSRGCSAHPLTHRQLLVHLFRSLSYNQDANC
jgi:hypothetical protein